jgi:uncharacterized protein (DUF433 family)
VATIFENLEAGASQDDVLSWCERVDRKQVQAIIECAARSLDLASTVLPADAFGCDRHRVGGRV